jgi:putative addiction module component (TIGR02574 family)
MFEASFAFLMVGHGVGQRKGCLRTCHVAATIQPGSKKASAEAVGTRHERVIGISAMGSPARQLESKALKLPVRERARRAERLLSSLDDQTDPDAEKLWVEEAERRLEELRSGTVTSRPAESVFRKARSRLR